MTTTVPAQTPHTGTPGDSTGPAGYDRVPPQDIDAEQSTLGGMLLSKDAIGEVVDVLGSPQPGVFYRPAHETIYRTIHDMWTAGEPVDPITTAAAIARDGDLPRVGGPAYLHALVHAVPTAANAAYYAEIILDLSRRRRLIEAATRAVQAAYSPGGDTAALIDTALADMQNLTLAPGEAPKLSVADRWPDFVDQMEQGEDPGAIDSPWRDLNDVLKVENGALITIGAATSGGKSLMAVNWGAHVALRRNKPVLMFSLEMDGAEILARMTAAEAMVPLDRITRRSLQDSDWDKIARVGDRMANAHNFVIDDGGSATLGHIRARARWMASTGRPPGLIIVDYLQLMEAEGKTRGHNRTQEVAEISRGLKRLAMDFKVPVITLAQFNREARDRRPRVTDFKDSSSIEQDSNIILLLHVETDDEGNELRPGEVDVIVAKNRNGIRDRVFPLAKLAHYGKLANLAGA